MIMDVHNKFPMLRLQCNIVFTYICVLWHQLHALHAFITALSNYYSYIRKYDTTVSESFIVQCISVPPGPPVLLNGGEETRRENEGLILDLSDPASPPAFPFPSQFMWSRQDGVELVNVTDTRVFSYPSIDIGSVLPSDTGLYTLTATNYQLDGVTPVGSDTASFNLNVLCEFTVIGNHVCTLFHSWGGTGRRWFRDSGSVGGRDSHSSVWY